MELLKAITLGIIQGLTEFLPISSSGHLVIGSELLQFHDPGITFEIFLHVGTLIAVIIAFRKDLMVMIKALFSSKESRRKDTELQRYYMWNFYVIVATVPAVVVGLFLKDSIEQIFDNIVVTFCMLAVTGCLMLATGRLKKYDGGITTKRALVIGMAQAMAILPGLSRSGSTIFAGMTLGVQRETAARFSFIMSIPAILGAAVLKLGDMLTTPPSTGELLYLLVGTLASIVSGYFAIIILMKFVRQGRLHWFGYYCLIVSAIGITWSFMQ